ncbi:TonB family protein [Erythrobacter sp. BLCC-B19]|uniref:TonB family protein n=1 Tax=Erythrobacter sp. BLCC-B19 TaxID=3025315 RepID=UPI002362F9F9|nr:TonB family protein [Erythrobacter sp. BLCC-B19]WDA40852.1 TonB family protein [Erythrobacter sp. BLCC-B19]
MINRLWPLAAFSLAIPATAQEPPPPPAKPKPEARGEERYFVPAPPGYRGKEVPQPIGSSNDWVTIADYPLDAWRAREEGVVQYDVGVDAQGKPTGCTITYSTATPALEAETCRLLLERARFEPAEDANGTPRASVWPGETKWQLREPEYPIPFTVKVAFTLDERGEQRDCRIVERSDKLPPDIQRTLERRPCPSSYGTRGVPYRDEEGRPIAREVMVTYVITLSPPPAGD